MKTANSSEVTSPTKAPMKTYKIHLPGTFKTKGSEIRHNGNTIFKTTKKKSTYSPLEIHLQQDEQTVVASVKFQLKSRGMLLHLGGASDETKKEDWLDLECENFSASRYEFVFNGRVLAWTRTTMEDNKLGASRVGGRDFKLVDAGGSEALVVFRYNYSMFKKGVMAEIDYYDELGQELEVLSLAAILGIQETVSGQTLNAIAGGIVLASGPN